MIPKRLLIHSCSVTRKGETDRDGNVLESASYSLTACRIDVTKGQIVTEVGYTKTDALTLFYDSVNSKSDPLGYEPKLDDRVKWNGNEYTIKNVRTLYTQGGAGDAPHHFEAVLV